MTKKIMLILLKTMLSVMLFADDDNIIETGNLVFIQPIESSEVFIDDVFIGESPIFLSNIKSNTSILLKSKDKMYEGEIIYNPDITKVTYISPVFGDYYGYLNIFANYLVGLSLTLNGIPFTSEINKPIKLNSGLHTVLITKEGYYPVSNTVQIGKLENLELNVALKKSILVSFDKEIPLGTSILFVEKSTGETITYNDNEHISLYEGDWELTITNVTFKTINKDFVAINNSMELPINIELYNPKVNLSGYLPGSKITLNGEDVTTNILNATLNVPVGENNILIEKNKFSPILSSFYVDGNDTFDIILDYNKDPIRQKKMKGTAGLSLAGSGIALLVSGLLMNSDSFALDNTSNYTDYTNMKYATLGTAGLGLLLSLTGTFLGFSFLMTPTAI
ncbi:MAG: PEGA domain-containing protein [Spirochaetaceae bacterium]